MNYTTLASKEDVAKAAEALKANNFEPIIVNTKEEALEKIKELIPKGASVMNGASRTLHDIGFIEYFKGTTHGWNNLHAAVLAEKDPAKQAELRKEAVHSDFYLGSVHALSQTGEMIIASNTGSQLPGPAFTAANLIFVVSTKKITPTLADAFKRLEEHVVPLEDARIMEAYKIHTVHAKTLILHKENPAMGRKVRVILINESLGF